MKKTIRKRGILTRNDSAGERWLVMKMVDQTVQTASGTSVCWKYEQFTK
jgi:hypothetical protein